MLRTEQLVAKFAELVKESNYIYISDLDRHRMLERVQKIVAEVPQSESEQTAQLNELQDLLQPVIKNILARTDEILLAEHRTLEKIMRLDPDMTQIFARHLRV